MDTKRREVAEARNTAPTLNRWGRQWTDETLNSRTWHADYAQKLRGALRDEHKHWASAGNDTASFYSPWKMTCKRAARYVRNHPGVSLKELIDGIDHHYRRDSTARSSMSQWIQKGRVPGIEARREGRYLRLYPTPEKPEVSLHRPKSP